MFSIEKLMKGCSLFAINRQQQEESCTAVGRIPNAVSRLFSKRLQHFGRIEKNWSRISGAQQNFCLTRNDSSRIPEFLECPLPFVIIKTPRPEVP
jgi:hypothetical protein